MSEFSDSDDSYRKELAELISNESSNSFILFMLFCWRLSFLVLFASSKSYSSIMSLIIWASEPCFALSLYYSSFTQHYLFFFLSDFYLSACEFCLEVKCSYFFPCFCTLTYVFRRYIIAGSCGKFLLCPWRTLEIVSLRLVGILLSSTLLISRVGVMIVGW